jgi:hypothetical protein
MYAASVYALFFAGKPLLREVLALGSGSIYDRHLIDMQPGNKKITP